MLSILVGHSYFLRFDRKQWDRAKPYPPLATLQTAAALRTAGHQVAVFDAMLADDTDQFVRQLRSIAPEVVVLYEDNFNFLSKMCLDKMRGAACRMISASRRQGARVVVAGSDATDAAHVYLAAGAEIVLLGEGLNTLSAICERLALQPQLATAELVAGLSELVFKRDGALIRAPGPTARTHAAHPEMPALDLIDVERYRTVWRRAHGYFSQNMSASRGCSFRCNWCSKPIWGNQYLQRPALEVAAEMTHLKRQFAPDHVWFADDNAIVREKTDEVIVKRRAPLLNAIVHQGVQEDVFTTPYPDQAGIAILSITRGMGNALIKLVLASEGTPDKLQYIEDIVAVSAASAEAIERVLGSSIRILDRPDADAVKAWLAR